MESKKFLQFQREARERLKEKGTNEKELETTNVKGKLK